MTRKIRAGLSNLLVFLLANLLVLGLVELGFRIFSPHPGYWHSEHRTLFQYDETLGWRFVSNKTGLMALPHENEVLIKINSWGMRDKERGLEKAPGNKRILVLGDSFTSGLGVQQNEVFASLMETKLADSWEVLNCGVDGYGPSQEFLLLKHRAMRFRPDLVILVIYIRNDFDDILGTHDWINHYARPMASLGPDGTLVWSNIPVPLSKARPPSSETDSVMWRLLEKSHFFNFCAKHHKALYRSKLEPPELRLCKKGYTAETETAYRLMDRLIGETCLFARNNGAEFAVIIAPTIVQIYPDRYWDRIRSAHNLAPEDHDLLLPNKKIAEACERAGCPLLDLTAELRAAASQGKDLYYRLNMHWNAEGHALVADSTLSFLKSRGLIGEEGQTH